MSGLQDRSGRTAGLDRPGYDGQGALLRPGALRVHLTVPQVTPPHAGAVVFEQDTCGVLVSDGRVRATRQGYHSLVEQMVAQRSFRPGSVVVRGRRRLRLYAVVHDLEREPSWREAWVGAALDEVLRVVAERAIRSLVLPPLGAVHGRLEHARFVQLLRRAMLARPVPCMRDLWLTAALDDLVRLRSALLRRPARESS